MEVSFLSDNKKKEKSTGCCGPYCDCNKTAKKQNDKDPKSK
jgi:hypothetical protein